MGTVGRCAHCRGSPGVLLGDAVIHGRSEYARAWRAIEHEGSAHLVIRSVLDEARVWPQMCRDCNAKKVVVDNAVTSFRIVSVVCTPFVSLSDCMSVIPEHLMQKKDMFSAVARKRCALACLKSFGIGYIGVRSGSIEESSSG